MKILRKTFRLTINFVFADFAVIKKMDCEDGKYNKAIYVRLFKWRYLFLIKNKVEGMPTKVHAIEHKLILG